MKVMISQPMAGKSDMEILTEREELVEQLSLEGHEVVDTIFDPQEPRTPIWYLSKSIETMDGVDAVVFMPGWEMSRGCKIEYEIAKNYGKFIREVCK